MTRSSRHKSHRSHKHSSRDARERSESEDDGSSRDRRQRMEEAGAGSGARVSRDGEADKKKSSSTLPLPYEKDKGADENGDCSAEHGRKRKEGGDGCVTPERWTVTGKDDGLAEKVSKDDGFRPVGPEKGEKSRVLTVESKSRSGKRREGSQERYGESGSRAESSKRKPEKEYSRREFREDKERDTERVSDNEKDRVRSSEREKRVPDSKHGKSDDVEIRSQGSRRAGAEEERATKKDRTEFHTRDDTHSAELEKDSDKFTAKRRKSSVGFDKWQDDGRNTDDKRLSSRDDDKRLSSRDDDKRLSSRDDEKRLSSRDDEKRLSSKDDEKRLSSRDDEKRLSSRDDDKRLSSRDDDKRLNSRDDDKRLSSRDDDKRLSSRDDDKRLSSRDDHKNGSSRDDHKNGSSRDDHKNGSSRDDHKNGSHKVDGHKDDKYKDERYRDKHYKDLDRDHRHRDIRHREERSSRDYTGDRMESKSSRDRDKPIETYSKKSKLHGSDREASPRAEDRGIKSKDSRARKTSHDENDDHYGSKHRNAKEPRADAEKDTSNSSKVEHRHQGKIDSSLSNNLSKGSPSPKTQRSKDNNRRGLKPAEYTNREPVSDDRARPPEDHDRVSVVHDRVSESLSADKAKHRDRIKADDRERRRSLENPSTENHFQADFQHVSVPPSPFKRAANFSSSSPGHILSQPPMRHGRDSPSLYEDDNRIKSGDRRSNNRYKRNNDPNIERGQGMAWKNGPAWPAPVPNGFIPFQHGPPTPGFHSGIQHFPPPSLFGARPYMDSGIPYHMHEVAERFTGHGHPFGWHHPAEDACPPQMQGWDSSNSIFSDKSQSYGRPGWDQNRHLVGGRGWELNPEMWKGQNASINTEFPAPQDPADESIVHSNLKNKSEVDQLQHVSGVAVHLKQCVDPPDTKSAEVSTDTELRKTLLISKKLDNNIQCLSSYLSKIDISVDLVHPELYKDIKNILMAGNSTGISDASMDEKAKKNKVRILSKGSNIYSPLPTAADTAFKRAMSVYQKQNYGRRAKPPVLASASVSASSSSKEENTSLPEATADANEVKAGPLPADIPSDNAVKNVGPNGSTAGPTEEEDAKSSPAKTLTADMHEIEHIKNSSDLISDIVLEESPPACEDIIMQECKVNLSRIHNPPESTH
ncbi:hypothetical protein KSP39_PZI013622 [Platanthera zijinensis]|uniref:Uncharacterized protein n=1 Tax=Platanthera zijinensis TaxID=2320716 RepID=A0AAP0G3P9_9ASPA